MSPLSPKGHKTTKSSKCLKNPKNKEANLNLLPDAAASSLPLGEEILQQQEAEIVMEDVDQMDQMPFVDELENADYEQDEFHDCGTWSEDEDGNAVHFGTL